MAEGLLRHHAGDRFDVHSAGLAPKGINPYAIQAMDALGIDIRGQRSKGIDEYMERMTFDDVITLCGHADQTCPQAMWAGGIKFHWPFDDPAAVEGTDAEKLAAFCDIRDQIEAKIRVWLAKPDRPTPPPSPPLAH